MRTPIARSPDAEAHLMREVGMTMFTSVQYAVGYAAGKEAMRIQCAWANALGRTLQGWRPPVWKAKAGDRVRKVKYVGTRSWYAPVGTRGIVETLEDWDFGVAVRFDDRSGVEWCGSEELELCCG